MNNENANDVNAEKQVTWGGRFELSPSELMLQFGESVSFDKKLAIFDIECSRAHSAMLAHTGLITIEEREQIHAALKDVKKQIEDTDFKWDIQLEDVHMNIEQALTKITPAAAKVHTARSRNDQVATDMRLFFKFACDQVIELIDKLLISLVEQAEKAQEIYIPGYTHLQRAQPVSAAHHLLAYVEMFNRDKKRFEQVKDSANWCPLGAGAMAGTTLKIDREFTAKELGFVDADGNPRVTANSMDSVADRDVFVEFANACALMGLHFSRIAEDFILWNSSEFNFILLSDLFTTGSSIMPQKKNPDSLELIRGKSARLQGNLQSLYTMVKGLPLTYNRDLQEDKPPVFDSLEQSTLCLKVLEGTISTMKFKEEACKDAVNDPLLLATDLADYLVNIGVPFRNAHHITGTLVGMAEKKAIGLNELRIEDVQSVEAGIQKDAWETLFNVKTSLSKREGTGMPGIQTVAKKIADWKKALGA